MPKPRKEAVKALPKRMHIYCEGAKTEPNYIEKYIESHSKPNLKTVIKIAATNKTTPIQLVEEAIKAQKSNLIPTGDEIWVVYDRESPVKYQDNLHARARSLAISKGINIALSNVCFEYWLMLHLVNTSAPYNSYDDLKARSPFFAELRRQKGIAYEKAYRIYDKIADEVAIARVRAHALNAASLASAPLNANAPHQLNPYTGMPLLLDAIDAF